MGAYRFERQPPVDGGRNALEFDSSADRAIARAFGYEEGSVELTEKSRSDTVVVFDVAARQHRGGADKPPKPLRRVGILKCMTRDEIWRRQTQGITFTRKWR